MKIKQKIMLLLGALLIGAVPMAAEETNLISNPGFEDYTHKNAVFPFPAYDEFDSWDKQGYITFAETSDKIEGNVSLRMELGNTDGFVYQRVEGLTDDKYTTDRKFELILHYKALTVPSGGAITLDCYWEAKTGATNIDEIKAHDADKLQRVLSSAPDSEWQRLQIVTTRPDHAKGLYIGIKGTKNSTVLIDSLSMIAMPIAPENEPYIVVTPDKLEQVDVKKGEEKAFKTLKIKQGYLTSPTTFRIGGEDRAHFQLSATELAETESELDLIITYAPTSTGTHEANLIFDNKNHTSILPDMIALKGICSDPSLPPSVSVTPKTLDFEAVEGKYVKQTVHVTSQNCTDWVYLKIDHIKGVGFTLSDGSGLVGKNDDKDISITFHPVEAGEFQSTLTFYSQINEFDPVVVTLNGKAEAKSEENIDWLTDFQWDLSSPRTMLNETFDNITHNEAVVIEGWQNVAAMDQRPWWGFDEDKTAPKRGKDKYAKATSYQYGITSTGTWTSWLVTPALDYKNAENKTFAFSIMGENLPEEGTESKLEIYYIDANITGAKDTVFFQDLTEAFDIPKTSDAADHWQTYFLDLSPYTIADIFHMGFRFEGPNGDEGATVYYIDNVSWGRTDLPELSVTPAYVIDSTAVVGEQKILAELSVSGKNLTEGISLSVAGANYNRFQLSVAELPKEGGKAQLAFQGMEAGVHEAYVVVSSKGAPEKYVPIAVKCLEAQGMEETESGKLKTEKVLRDGQLYLMYKGTMYDVQGRRIEN